ncbi:hypothetical protein CL652_03025 [bacterium]|nr:hypothetical protein [bacterium]|tara:strand:- start:39883 stop:40191 length:309 start_codon:yes stop_codon:yes gene_type:complete
MAKEFQRRVEDFDCEHCDAHVEGDGYTNHCPECLWSKHVDVNPGDRAATCGGLMKPIEVVQSGNDYILMHKCTKCDYVKKNKLARNDNMETVVELARELANK